MYQKGEQADPHQQPANRLKRASDSAKKMVWLKMAECSAPAMVVGVAVNGKPVWKHGRPFYSTYTHYGDSGTARLGRYQNCEIF